MFNRNEERKVKEFKEHYTKGKRLVTSSKVKEVDENYLSLSGNQCDFIDSIDYSIPPCYPSDEEIEKIKRHIVKASYNIIDILEEGDIIIDSVEKHEILLIDGELMVRNTGLIYDNNYYLPIKSITIKSVITHEQMEQINYKLGE